MKAFVYPTVLLLAGMHWWRSYPELMFLLGAGENRFRQWVIGTTLFLILAMVFVFLASQNIL